MQRGNTIARSTDAARGIRLARRPARARAAARPRPRCPRPHRCHRRMPRRRRPQQNLHPRRSAAAHGRSGSDRVGTRGAVVDPQAAERRRARQRTRHGRHRRGASPTGRCGSRAPCRASCPAARAVCSGSRSCRATAIVPTSSTRITPRHPTTGSCGCPSPAPRLARPRRARAGAHRHRASRQPQRRAHRLRARRVPLRHGRRRGQSRCRAGPGLARRARSCG